MENRKQQQPIPEEMMDEQLDAVTGGEGLEQLCPQYTLDPSVTELKDLIRTRDIVDPTPLLGQIKPQSDTCTDRE